MTQLKDRVALVTGAQQGIGRAMALATLEAGLGVEAQERPSALGHPHTS